jgi:hypothetical protein
MPSIPFHLKQTRSITALLNSCLAFGLACLLLPAAARAQSSVNETFSGPTLSSDLELSLADSFSFNGVATNTANTRAYIRTVATNFNTVDFSLAVTYTISPGAGGGGTAFFGLGSGAPDGSHYGEPLTAGYMRSKPDVFEPGGSQISINNGSALDESRADFGTLGDGTHRALITKTGNTLTFAIDAGSDSLSGAFVAEFSTTLNISTELSFLNNTNSRLFVGGETTEVTFDSMVITTTAVPEPAAAGLITGFAALGLMTTARRPRRE